jgi:hypothetical protein
VPGFSRFFEIFRYKYETPDELLDVVFPISGPQWHNRHVITVGRRPSGDYLAAWQAMGAALHDIIGELGLYGECRGARFDEVHFRCLEEIRRLKGATDE